MTTTQRPVRGPGTLTQGPGPVPGGALPPGDGRRRAGGPLLLRLQMFALLAAPSYMVLEPLGAPGSIPQLLALALAGLWVVAAVFGRFDAWETRHPGRVGLMCWVVVSLLSYAAMYAGQSGASTAVERASADRWLLLVFAGLGLTLSVTQALVTREDVRRAVAWLLAGASVCCLVATVQFVMLLNPLDWIEQSMIGFTDNGGSTPFQPRGAFARVAGTTMHPIELGVVCGMLLPLSAWWGLFSTQRRAWLRWTPAMLLLAGSVVTVSRSAILGLVVAAVVMIPHLPVLARRWALVIAPVFLVGMFVAIPGMVSTLFGAATAGTADPSISARTDDYPLAWTQLVQQPVLGHGPGTWMPINAMDIFDNQYLLTAVTMGVAGLGALVLYLALPAAASLLAARHAPDAELRLLSGSVAAAMVVAIVASGTFDSFSFPTFALLTPIFVGLAGVVWLQSRQQSRTHPAPVPARDTTTPQG